MWPQIWNSHGSCSWQCHTCGQIVGASFKTGAVVSGI